MLPHHSARRSPPEGYLEGGERHSLSTVAALDPVVFPPEAYVVLVEGDEATVGDGTRCV